jgi:arabinose-5-phosphate isomerase
MPEDILEAAREILRKEVQALENSMKGLDDGFVRAVRMIRRSKGKVVVTGLGKSGLIGQKIAATMASTGTVAIFMHAVDALHGDLGMVAPDDVVLAISNSGQSAELLDLVAAIRKIGAKTIAMVGNPASDMAQACDCVIRLDVPREADHLNLAPTASALAALGIGDALAGVLSRMRGFRHEDFALYHPSGAIGRRLLLTVKDLMHSGKEHPMVTPKAGIDEVLAELTEKRLGGVNVVDNRRSRRLVGFIVDGDLKRELRRREKFFDLKAADIMTATPTTIYADEMAAHALELMENRPSQIYVLPVVNRDGRAVGILRLHDLVQLSR